MDAARPIAVGSVEVGERHDTGGRGTKDRARWANRGRGRRAGARGSGQRHRRTHQPHHRRNRQGQCLHALQRDHRHAVRHHPGVRRLAGFAVRLRAGVQHTDRDRAGVPGEAHARPAGPHQRTEGARDTRRRARGDRRRRRRARRSLRSARGRPGACRRRTRLRRRLGARRVSAHRRVRPGGQGARSRPVITMCTGSFRAPSPALPR